MSCVVFIAPGDDPLAGLEDGERISALRLMLQSVGTYLEHELSATVSRIPREPLPNFSRFDVEPVTTQFGVEERWDPTLYLPMNVGPPPSL